MCKSTKKSSVGNSKKRCLKVLFQTAFLKYNFLRYTSECIKETVMFSSDNSYHKPLFAAVY